MAAGIANLERSLVVFFGTNMKKVRNQPPPHTPSLPLCPKLPSGRLSPQVPPLELAIKPELFPESASDSSSLPPQLVTTLKYATRQPLAQKQRHHSSIAPRLSSKNAITNGARTNPPQFAPNCPEPLHAATFGRICSSSVQYSCAGKANTEITHFRNSFGSGADQQKNM